jgi:hypothetical protein
MGMLLLFGHDAHMHSCMGLVQTVADYLRQRRSMIEGLRDDFMYKDAQGKDQAS